MMDLNDLRGSVAIVGVGQAGCGEAGGRTEMEILAEASRLAIEDASLTLDQIDGIATASSSSAMWGLSVVEYMGLRPRFLDTTMIGGSSFVSHMLPSMLALATGQCDAVLVCYGSTQRTSTMNRAAIKRARRQLEPNPYEDAYEPLTPLTSYALAAARHMHQYGTTREQLAEVAVAARQWASLNPEAFTRDPLTVQDVLSARMVSDPLTVRDSCLITDGAGAYVMVRADRARDLHHKPGYVLGSATATWNKQISAMHDLTITAAVDSGKRAYEMAGVGPNDMDVLELYDAFTINPILFLEDLGFCPKGEGGRFVQDGRIAPGGSLPVNTNGGGLSCVHPGMYGIFITIEAVRQLRGDCGARQVQGADLALVHGNGGTLSSQSTAILGTEATL